MFENQIYQPNTEDLIAFHKKICSEAEAIIRSKNHDYSSGCSDSIFANFERAESMGVCSVEQGFLVRIIDKISRLSTFVSTGNLQVKSESYNDAIHDIINYLVLFSCFEYYCRDGNPGDETDPETGIKND